MPSVTDRDSDGLSLVRRLRLAIVVGTIAPVVAASTATGEIIFESGTLGPTGVSYADLVGPVEGTNVNPFVFPGVRFELTQPAITTQIGGHFVEETPGTFFGAIVKLDDENDFPNSIDLSTSDVLGAVTLTFPDSSQELFGNLNLSLDPGWYALVFGSGLFGTYGWGGTVRNGMDIGDPTYIGFDPNLNWFNLDILQRSYDNHRFVVKGTFVPEPNMYGSILFVLMVLSRLRLK